MKKSLLSKSCFLLFIITSFSFASCKKDGNSAKAKTDNLTGVTWTSSRIEFQKADGTWQEQHDADLNFAFVFNADNTFSAVQTTPSGHYTDNGAWHLINGNTQLTLSGNAYQGTYTVTQLTSSTLQWTVTSPGFWGTSNAVRETFGH